jgi:hypothetical protein
MADSERRSRRGVGVTLAVLGAVFVALGFVFFYYVYPIQSVGPAQPIPFSHRLHVTVKEIDCRFCHNTAGYTRFAGMPPPQKCLFCHQFIIPAHPRIVELRRRVESGESVAWEKVTWLPDHVYFSHQRHVRFVLDCSRCHGPVETMDRVSRTQEFNMGFCLECHQRNNVPVGCTVCHQ